MNDPALNDELLMAYADGALPHAEAETVRHVEREHAAVAERIELYRSSGRLLREVAQLLEEVPGHLYETVRKLGHD